MGEKLKKQKAKKILPHPVEAWDFYNHIDPNFFHYHKIQNATIWKLIIQIFLKDIYY